MLRLAISWVLVPVLFALLPVGSASAATIQYATRAAWQAAVGSFVTEDFEGIPIQEVDQAGGSIVTPGFDIVIPGNHGDIGIQGVGNHYFVGDSHCYEGEGACDGPGFPGGDPGDNDLVFHEAITALAVDIPFVEDADGDDDDYPWVLRLHILGDVFSMPSDSFLGIVSDVPFSVVHIRADRLFYHLDNVSTPIPEPSTAAQLVVGLIAIAATRRRYALSR